MRFLPLLACVGLGVLPAADEPAKAAPAKPELGKPIVVDGIEIILNQVRVGGESEKPPKYGDLPTAQFLKVSFSMKNVTANQIVTVQDPWQKTKLKDEHGNFYKSEQVGLPRASRLRPGKELVGVIYFEVPLETARNLQLISDPCFYRDNGEGMLDELSKLAFSMEIENPAAVAKAH